MVSGLYVERRSVVEGSSDGADADGFNGCDEDGDSLFVVSPISMDDDCVGSRPGLAFVLFASLILKDD